MELKIWRPWFELERDVRSMFERLPRMLGEFASFDYRPKIDIVHDDDHLVITAELPGIDPERDIELLLEGDVLILKGEKSAERELGDERRYVHERYFGTFERRIPLPDGVDKDMVDASYEKGILTIRVPLPEPDKEETVRVPVTPI